MMPARIVAVTGLLVEVLDDLAQDPALDFGSAEGALFFILGPHRAELAAVNKAAVKEMQDLPARVLSLDAIRAPERGNV